MPQMVSQSLWSAAQAAIARGLDFLESAVGPDGAWRCDYYGTFQLEEDRIPPFVAALGVVALQSCPPPQHIENILSRSRGFILSHIKFPGIWRWAPHGFEVDSTSVCSLAVGRHSHPWLFFGRNVQPVLSCRDDNGRFLTWMSSFGPFGMPNDDDPIVNANVVTYLGDREETRPVQQWIERLIVEDRVPGSSIWYNPMDLYCSVSRASCIAPPAFETVRLALGNRIREVAPETAYRAAQIISSLDMLADGTNADLIARRAEQLVDMQRADGGWPPSEFLRAPEGSRIYVSEALTAAYCVEALSRLARS